MSRFNARPHERALGPVPIGPFTGCGPRRPKHSDEQILESVLLRLTRHGQVDATGIQVSCVDAIITLKGEVTDAPSRHVAATCLSSIFGVQRIVNEIRVARAVPSTPAN